MAATYIPIASTTLSTTAASVTFSSIPATYTDLVLRVSVRTDRASQATDVLLLKINTATTNLSHRWVRGDGTNATSNTNSAGWIGVINASTSTASTFTNAEIYLPNYLANANKPFSSITAQENNQTGAFVQAQANLWSNTSAITELRCESATGNNFVSGSTFHLYGISNA